MYKTWVRKQKQGDINDDPNDFKRIESKYRIDEIGIRDSF